MASRWNLYLGRTVDLGLTLEEFRAAQAIARFTLGYNKTSAEIPRELLRQYARLHGQSLDRALDGLIDKGLLLFTPGRRGRGRAATYELVLENAADERPFERQEGDREKAAENAAQNAAAQRHKKEREKGKSPTTADETEAERVFACTVLTEFNTAADADYRASKFLLQIVARHRERPDLTVDDHAAIIRAALSEPWWRGTPTPAVIYKTTPLFEQAIATRARLGRNLSAIDDL